MPMVQTAAAPTFETVWAALQEVAAMQKETDRIVKENAARQEKTDREIAETSREVAETSREVAETSREVAETGRQIKAMNKRFGFHVNNFGKVVEYMVAPKLCKKFQELGFEFEQQNSRTKIKNRKLDISFEIDIFLENGEKAMLVEVKTNLGIDDVNRHIERMEKMRLHADSRSDKRAFLGAVAGVVVSEDTEKYALEQGFYLIEPSGESFKITPPTGKPKEW